MLTRIKIAFFSSLTLSVDRVGHLLSDRLAEWLWSHAAEDAEKQYRDRKRA